MFASEQRRVALCVALAALVALAGCSEFPCESRTSVHEVPTVSFTDSDAARFMYWFEDGAQRLAVDRDDVPEPARHAVIVHIKDKTDGSLHGAAGWVADISDADTVAAYVPMARARTAAYAGWSGSWLARWVHTRAITQADNIVVRDELRDQLGDEEAAQPDEAERDALDPLNLIANLRGEEGEDDMPTRPAAPDHAPRDLARQLDSQGLSIDELKVTRALRVVGARQPFPRDFGLSVDVHATLLFVSQDCAACDEAMAWLDERGIGYHAMLVTDPTNASTLRDVTTRANIQPAVPLLWQHTRVLRGFDRATWDKELP